MCSPVWGGVETERVGAGMRAGIVAAVLLLVASHAWAECAWMLWMEGTGTLREQTEKVWEVYDTTESQQGCKARLPAAREAMAIMLRGTGDEVSVLSGGTVRRLRKNGAEIFYRFQCLPDTVDPRGPKAK